MREHTAILEKLAAVYPRTFFRNQADRQPLKLHIHHDIVADMAQHGLSRDELRAALVQYCRSPGYCAALVKDAVRIDLAGEPAGTVTAEAVSAAIKAARSERRRSNVEKKVVAVAVAPEQQTKKAAAPEPAPNQNNQNGKRVSLADLRAAAKARQAIA